MFKNKKFWGLPALLVALTTWACTDAGNVLSPSGISADISSVEVDGIKYKITKGKSNSNVRTESAVFGLEGGTLGVAGHQLTVPAGAVLVPTKFVISMIPPDATTGSEYVKVELRAFEKDSNGDWTVDVGPRGFLKPVQLGLTYKWMTDKVDPAKLKTAWVKPDGTGELYVSSLDTNNHRVVSGLTHFSDYALVMP